MKTIKFTKNQKDLRKRIIDISYKNRLSHIGSCLNVVDLIDSVYERKRKDDVFVLSAGHSAVAWYAVMEKYTGIVKYDKIDCIHPDRLTNKDVHVSTGSLGQGLPIALGIALSNRKRMVYCLISDGESNEGSIWESLRIVVDNSISNLVVLISANEYGAYDKINSQVLKNRVSGFGLKVIEIDGHKPKEINKALATKSDVPFVIFAHTDSEQLPFLVGQAAHYYVMNDDLSIAEKNLS